MIVFNYNHRLADTPTIVRAVYIIPTFTLVYLTNTFLFNGIVALLYIILTKHITGTSCKQLFRLYAFPLLFLFIGCLTIALSFSGSSDYQFFANLPIGFSDHEVTLATDVFFRGAAILSIVFFGILTHSISEIAALMHNIRVPNLFIELFILTYKFIFNLALATKNMYTAQKLRLAYQKPGDVKTFSLLMAAIFRKAFAQSTNLAIAIDARLGTGSFHFISKRKHFEMNQLIGPSMFTLLLVLVFIIFQNHG